MTEGHTDIQRETIIPHHYCVAGYKKENVLIKKFCYFFHISAQIIDCEYSLEPPRQGGSIEYQQSILFTRNMTNNVYPVNPSFII